MSKTLKSMQATITKISDAQKMGRYQPTAVDQDKINADFRLVDVQSKSKRIIWRDGRRETVSARKLAKLQAAHSWACDF